MDETPLVIVEVSALDFDPSLEFDSITVTISASGSPGGGDLCRAAVITSTLGDPAAPNHATVPFSVGINPGTEFNQVLFVRVEALSDGVVRFRDEQFTSLTGGKVTLKFEISPACLAHVFEPGEVCKDGALVPTEIPGSFDGTGVSCVD